MRPKSLILLMLALGCGLVASIGVNQVMSRRQATSTAQVETTPVFVALADIGIGDPLKPEMLKLVEWPKSKLPPGSLSKLEDVEGRRTRTKVFAGEPLLEAKLFATGESGATATDLIPKGFRVVAIQVDAEKTGGNLIRPGDRVDVLVHLAENRAKGIPRTTSRTFLQNIKVFAVDNVYHPDKEDDASTGRTVSLLVSPSQAEMVTMATELGEIRLVLRSVDDEVHEMTAGVTPEQLMGASPIETAAPPSLPKINAAPIAQGLLGLLNNQSSTNPTEKAEPAEEPIDTTWRMVLLLGDELQEIEIAKDGRPTGPGEAGSKDSSEADKTSPAILAPEPENDGPTLGHDADIATESGHEWPELEQPSE